MKNFSITLSSTIIMVLFCFLDTYSLPLTRSCYTTPEDKINIELKEEFIYIDSINRKDNYSFNTGISGNTSFGLDFSLIHYNSVATESLKSGDIFFNIWHFAGDYFDGFLDSGVNIVIRIPTGPDVYKDQEYRNLSFGNNELKIAPVLSFNLTETEVFLFNIGYTFREGKDENFYRGFKINPMKVDTYKSCFGLNPFYKDAFLERDNLKNDYTSIAGGLLTSRFLPWVLFMEIYYSSGLYKCADISDKLNIEGDGINPFRLSIGFKYIFSDSFFVQTSAIADLLQKEGYIKNSVEFSLNIIF